MKTIFNDDSGFIFRGVAAIIFFIIITIATLIDLVSGHTESLSTWFSVLIVSAVLTGISFLTNRGRSTPKGGNEKN